MNNPENKTESILEVLPEAKQVVLAMRLRLQRQRLFVNEGASNKKYARYRLRSARTELSLLVPLYRAMVAALLQADSGGSKGVSLYTERFQKLGRKIQLEVKRSQLGWSYAFNEGADKIQVLVPEGGVPVANWRVTTLLDLFKEAEKKLGEHLSSIVSLGKQMKVVREEFFKSLTCAQLDILKEYFTLGKKCGIPSLGFDALVLDRLISEKGSV